MSMVNYTVFRGSCKGRKASARATGPQSTISDRAMVRDEPSVKGVSSKDPIE